MNDPQNNPQAAADRAAEPAEENRKLYRKPSFQSEQVFETMALQCGKVGATSFSCTHSGSAS